MYVPHQIHLTPIQAHKLMSGGAVNIPVRQMGSDKGSEVVLFKAPNAKKLMSGFKRNKGVRIMMSPDEIEATMMKGSGVNIGKAFKKLGKDIKSGAEKAGSAISREVINPYVDAVSSKQAMNVYKQIGKHAIEQGIPVATALASMALGDPTGMSGAVVGNVAQQYASKAYSQKTGAGMRPDEARKEYMKLIRSMRGMSEAQKAQIKGSGFFKTLKKTTGIGKTQFISGAKKIGKNVLSEASQVAGQALTAYTGNPMAGAMLTSTLDKSGGKMIDSIEPSKGKLGIKFDPRSGMKSLSNDAKMFAIEAIDREIDKLPPEYRGVAQDALAGKYPDAQSLIYDVGSKSMSESDMRSLMGLGMRSVKKGRGATQSKAFKQALKNNYGGLALTNSVMDNVSVSEAEKMGARLSANVRPSQIETPSDYGFMSPYQRMDSPAMNPFVPTTYLQQGGTSSGYGGVSQSELNKLMGAGLYYGRGLYGNGLY
jgi:hypothetical protein